MSKLRERVERDSCRLALGWGIRHSLAQRLVQVAGELDPLPLYIVSGYRTCAEEAALADGIDCSRSTHTTCPATGADVNIGSWLKATTPNEIRARFGAAVQRAGLRWGGGSTTDPDTGIPRDWNHVDEGPRTGSGR